MKNELVFSKFSAVVAEQYLDKLHQMIWEHHSLLVKPMRLQETMMNEIMIEIDTICRRALVYEFKQFEMRTTGQLTFQEGSTKCLIHFCSQINSSYVAKFMQRYAYLDGLIKRRIPMIINFGGSVLEDFDSDRFQLGQKILNCTGSQLRIEDFNYQRNDTRNGAQKVLVIITSFGKIVYKPHRLNNDIFFEKMLGLLNKKSGKKTKLVGVKSITVDLHGWQEYINQSEFKGSPSEYYYEFGILAAWAWLFKIGDLHNGNVLQTAQGIRVIDLENLMTNQISDESSEKIGDCYSNFIRDSVLGSLLLPLHIKFYNETIDYSGFRGSKEQYIKVNQLVDLGTDNLRFDFTEKRIIKNDLELKNEPVVRYQKVINQGFIIGVQFIQEHLSEVKRLLDGTYSRQLVASSDFYKKLQGNMTHPKYATSMEQVNGLIGMQVEFSNLDNQKILTDLKNYDIPYQECEINEKDINYLIFQVSKITPFQIDQQLELIRCALKTLEESPAQAKVTSDITNVKQRIFKMDFEHSILFISQFNEDQRLIMAPIDCSLWVGLGEIENILLFSDRNNTDLVQRTLKTVLEMYPVEQLIAEGLLSGYNGVGAYLLVLAHLKSKWAIQQMHLILNELLHSELLIQDWSFFEGAGSLVWIVFQLAAHTDFKKQCSKLLVMLKKQFDVKKVKSRIEKKLIVICLGKIVDRRDLPRNINYPIRGSVREGVLLVNLSSIKSSNYLEEYLKKAWGKQAFKVPTKNDSIQNGLIGKLLVAKRLDYYGKKKEQKKRELMARIDAKNPRVLGETWGVGYAGLQYYLLAEQTGNADLLFCKVGWDD
ncbi:type 2 lanthipeptide synthetase LanM [Pediococcus claussenii]|uniref:Lantibiotic biosynthesis protein dehydration domain-containing protein n=1 Tax=Pediococcus claussenii (strain ATCC BAA-344 / DSM 14800 / JCM 18046 / KCTC 3811 / LMG 21948 / P06) TaxID=701521 RepID=G8PEK4_PEDCP|nr:type 2 lanthipeptide synthetase LanM [Pediococcus claussenii]AEV95613.1 hypothetical protein PECL_1387 [Pediococcus claussenii ATCC BAA-344]ANZ69133.1 hypothetical protein AYR57_01920 [Pediococcus claussenii]ANZ70950.1 hypothetical protein AYR58_01920 [Pediococcus claussenii]KRN20154.1 hypothetical protein IV79_GL000820 [Pediococcus claussenii]